MKRLAKLIGESEQTIIDLVSKLESQNGHPSHDVRHIAETHQQTRKILQSLNLDPDDTTAPELYHALQTKFEDDSEKLDDLYEAGSKSFDERTALAAGLINRTMKSPRLWVLKKSTAKEIIKKNPPKHLMKAAGYRSVASLLRREDIREVALAAEILETESWHKAQTRLTSKLDQSAFELGAALAVRLNADWFLGVDTSKLVITSDTHGLAAILPSELTKDLPLLSIVLLLAENLQSFGGRFQDAYGAHDLIGWWSAADGLVAALGGKVISLNIKDVSANWLYGHDFKNRQLESGRKAYWQNLISKYSQNEHIEAVFDDSVVQRVRQLKSIAPQPAYEYDFAEEFADG